MNSLEFVKRACEDEDEDETQAKSVKRCSTEFEDESFAV